MKNKNQNLIYRTLDSAINRVAEGLRVLEDYQRMIASNEVATKRFKNLRHELTAITKTISVADRLAVRDSQQDVGRENLTESEYERSSLGDIAAANFSRVQQGLRSIEEFTKTFDQDMSKSIEQLRYETYSLQKVFDRQLRIPDILNTTSVYVLLDGRNSFAEFCDAVTSLLQAGVRLIQLRDKNLDACELLKRGMHLTEQVSDYQAAWIMNDRLDLAIAANAQGVHVGQEDLPIREVRKQAGNDLWVGVSTHSLTQAREAELAGADYIGVGPTFPSQTKSFEDFPGLDLVQQVAKNVAIPAFAIGGIHSGNVAEVAAHGLQQVAVQQAVLNADDRGAEIRKLNSQLDGRPKAN